MQYRLLERFEALFRDNVYKHRSPVNGDLVAVELYEDLLTLARSPKFVTGVSAGSRVVNAANKTTGIKARRGDGSFGELLPHVLPIAGPGYSVRRGPIASIEVGIETKILATAIGKQVQERISSLIEQAQVFRASNSRCICVAIVGVNYAPSYLAYDGERLTLTDGRKYAHPAQQAPAAEAKVRAELRLVYDEVIVLPFVATNQPPLAFVWASSVAVMNEYGAALLRISNEYERRF